MATPNDETFPAMEAAWDEIKQGVHQILESHPGATAGYMNTLGLFQIEFDTGERSPRTVYVSLDYDSDASTWPPVVRELEAYVARWPALGLDVYVGYGETAGLGYFD
ncbi:hypothetical protein B0T16DRAFT_419677 [Cercophora newfieldiana]|uniref:Uncharacterized protein n=1 Tax=Cercophora newfieldiana TaxID=92897 RepID=A0AA39XW32_9PEZI|nr:hypothetical protein B0T16DRAFT_419677 [Cercophora newfieldiana]